VNSARSTDLSVIKLELASFRDVSGRLGRSGNGQRPAEISTTVTWIRSAVCLLADRNPLAFLSTQAAWLIRSRMAQRGRSSWAARVFQYHDARRCEHSDNYLRDNDLDFSPTNCFWTRCRNSRSRLPFGLGGKRGSQVNFVTPSGTNSSMATRTGRTATMISRRMTSRQQEGTVLPRLNRTMWVAHS